MKNKLTAFIILILFIVLLVCTISFGIYSTKLQNLVDEQNITLAEYANMDSLSSIGQEDVIKTINKFFQNAPTKVDGKIVNPVDYIVHNNKLVDSIKLLNWDLNFIYETYGIRVNRNYNKDGSTTTSMKPGAKVDSAMVLLSVFRDRLERKNNSWSISVEGERYDDLRSRYNNTLEENVTLANEKSKLSAEARKLKNDVKFYKDLLESMRKKGVLKIDSVDNDTRYTY